MVLEVNLYKLTPSSTNAPATGKTLCCLGSQSPVNEASPPPQEAATCNSYPFIQEITTQQTTMGLSNPKPQRIKGLHKHRTWYTNN